MKKFLEKSLAAAQNYDLVDFAIFKFCLLGVGILFGSTFASLFRKKLSRLLVGAATLFSLLYLLYKTFYAFFDPDSE